MILGLQSVILGRDWIQTVNLFSDFGKQNYFIPVPLNVKATGENFPNIRIAQTYEDNVGLHRVPCVTRCDRGCLMFTGLY